MQLGNAFFRYSHLLVNPDTGLQFTDTDSQSFDFSQDSKLLIIQNYQDLSVNNYNLMTAAKVYSFDGSAWIQEGQAIDWRDPGPWYPSTPFLRGSISGDGKTLAFQKYRYPNSSSGTAVPYVVKLFRKELP